MLRSLHYVGPVAPPQSKNHAEGFYRMMMMIDVPVNICCCFRWFCFAFAFAFCFAIVLLPGTPGNDIALGARCTGKLLFLYCCIFFSPASCIVVLVPSGRRASSSVPPGRRASSSGTSGRRAWHHALASVPPGIEPWPQPMVRRRCSGKLFFFFYIVVFSFSLTHHHQQFCFYVPAFLSPSFYTGWLLLLSSDSSSSVQPCPPVRWASSLGLRFAGHPALASTRRCTGKLLFFFFFCSHFISSHRRSRPWLIVVFSLLFQIFLGEVFLRRSRDAVAQVNCCFLFSSVFIWYLLTRQANPGWLFFYLLFQIFLEANGSSGHSLLSGRRPLSSRDVPCRPGVVPCRPGVIPCHPGIVPCCCPGRLTDSTSVDVAKVNCCFLFFLLFLISHQAFFFYSSSVFLISRCRHCPLHR